MSQMHSPAALRLIPLALVIASAAFAQSDAINLRERELGPYLPEQQADLGKARAQIVDRTNTFRAANEREALTSSPKLREAAQQLADFMAESDLYGHRADGKSPSDRIKAAGYTFCSSAENIAFQFRTGGYDTTKLATTAVESWINSPPHRDNMLKPYATELGVGVAQSETTGIYYTVQVFGRPLSAALTIKVRNTTDTPVSYNVGQQVYEIKPRVQMTHRVCVPTAFSIVGSETETTPKDGDTLNVEVTDGVATLQLEETAAEGK